jgi:hypothetical protein
MGEAFKSPCTHRSQAGRTSHNGPPPLTPAYPSPHISVLTGCRVLARAHLYARARYIVVRVLSLESVRSGRIRRSTGAICTVLRMDFREFTFQALR